MKARPILFRPELLTAVVEGRKTQTRRIDRRWLALEPGDALWCKEKLIRQDADHGDSWAEYARDGRYVEPSPFKWTWQRDWLSPLHMPRRAARVFLEVVKKPRLEVVRHISEADAKAEGFASDAEMLAHDKRPIGLERPLVPSQLRMACHYFHDAWLSIHPDTGLNVEAVVITFKLRGSPC